MSKANERLSPADHRLAFYLCHANLIIDAYDVTGYENESGFIHPLYPYEWEENERKIKITEWYDQNGQIVFNSSRFKLELFNKVFNLGGSAGANGVVSSDPVDLKDEKAWGKYTSSELGGWAGNEGVTKTTKYSKYLLVMWPQRFELETVIKMDVKFAIESLYESLVNKKQAVNEQKLREFASIMQSASENKEKKLSEGHMAALIELMSIVGEFDHVITFFSKMDPKMNQFTAAKFADLVARFGDDRIKKYLKPIVKSTDENFIPNCYFVLVSSPNSFKIDIVGIKVCKNIFLQ